MGCGEEEEGQEGSTTVLKLPLLLSKSHTHSHTHSLSSPIHPTVAASVPFSWEEEPGKPKLPPSSSSSSSSPPSSASSSSSCSPKSLELPPRLLNLLEKDGKSLMTKMSSSPTTVLDGPYSMGRSRRFDSSSFRMMVTSTAGGSCYGSFRSEIDVYGDIEESEEEEEKKKSSGPLVLPRKRGGYRGRLGFVGFWRRKRALKGKTEFGGGSYVFPSSVDRESELCRRKEEEEEEEEDDDDGGNGRRTSGFSYMASASKPHFWVSPLFLVRRTHYIKGIQRIKL